MEKLAQTIVEEMVEQEIIPDDNDTIECYIYGLQLVISSFLILIAMMILATISGQIIECLFFALCFCPLRAIVGGYHCKKFSSCFLLSLGFWCILDILLYFNVHIHILILLIITSASGMYILKNSPLEHSNNPLTLTEIKTLKKRTFIFLICDFIGFILLAVLNFYNFALIMSYSIIVISFLMIKANLGGDT